MTHKLTRLLALMLAVVMTFSMLLIPTEASSFRDVTDGSWYAAAVEYVYEKGWMAGVSETSFAPNATVTRGMMVTVLARLAEVQTDDSAAVFQDTREGKWYTGAASWAAMNRIVAGVGDWNFAPNRAITRQDLCVMLYAYIQNRGVKLENTVDRTFTDMESVSEYARDAVIYCTGTGLIAGFEDSSFRPKSTATRAQLAQILMRMDQMIQGQAPAQTRPAQSFAGEAGEDMGVSVSAPAGALPENTEMTVSRVTDEAYLAALEKQSGVKVAAAADITFTKDGAELEPEKAVEVQLSLAGMEELENPTVLHVRDDGVLEYVSSELVSATRSGSKSLRFQAKDFSVYIIGSGSTVELFNVTFYESDGEGGWQIINKQAIRKDQVGEGKPLGNTPVYDPGVPSITETQAFEGWAESSTITDETVGKTVSNINAYVMENYTTLDQNEHSLSYYAIVRDVVFITYHDQDGTVIRLVSSDQGDYTIDMSYSPFKGGWAHLGWTETINNTGEEPTYPENVLYYENGKTIQVTRNIDLYPYLKEGFWLVFDNYIDQDLDSTSASFTSPKYYGKTEPVPEPDDYGDANNDGVDHDAEPYRTGYTFGGWYTKPTEKQAKNANNEPLYIGLKGELTTEATQVDDDGVTQTLKPRMIVDQWPEDEFEWDQPLTANTTVYAKWVPKTDTKYTVMLWTQSVNDAWNTPDGDKTYDFYEAIETRKGTTGQIANFIAADTQRGDTVGSELGYYFIYNATNSDTDGVEIKGDGSTVVNVYYDRRVVEISFNDMTYTAIASNPTLTSSSSASSDGSSPVYFISYNRQYCPIRYYKASGGTVTTDVYVATTDLSSTTSNQYAVIKGKWYKLTYVSGTGWTYNNTELGISQCKWTGTRYMFSVELTPSDARNNYTWYEQTFTPISTIENNPRKGLYGSPMPTWPEPGTGYDWNYVDDEDGQSWGLTPYDQYAIPEAKHSLEWVIYREEDPVNDPKTVHWMQEKVDQDLVFDQKTTTTLNSGTDQYYNDEKFLGFNAYGHNLSANSITSGFIAYTDGAYADNSEAGSDIFIYFTRRKYEFAYFSRGSEVQKVENVKYGTSLASFANVTPTNGPVGYYFDGWYKDPGCTEKYEWTGTMPNNNVAVYAKWTVKRFRVILDYSGGEADAEVTFPGNQASTFRLDYGEKIRDSAIAAASREGYTLLGWYLDPNGDVPFNFGEAITDKTTNMDLTYTYGSGGRSGIDPVNGNKPYDDDELDENNQPKYKNVIGKLVIYALWRQNPIGSDGVRVRYDAIEGEGYFAPKTDPRVLIRDDPNIYTDKAKAFAQPASTPEDDVNYQFLYWVVMQPVKDGNGNVVLDENGEPKLEQTTIKVYPGQTFTVDYNYTVRTEAVKVTWEFMDPDGDQTLSDVTTVTKGAVPQHSKPSGYVSGGYYYPVVGWSDGTETYYYDGENHTGTDVSLPAVSAKTTFTAVYGDPEEVTQHQFTVTWKNWDGTELATETYTAGATPTYKGTTPTRPQDANYTYTFSGWTPAITVVSGDAAYTAAYTATDRQYTITFYANASYGGAFSDSTTTKTVTATKGTLFRDIFPADPTNSNSDRYFLGWFTAGTGGTEVAGTDEFDGTVTEVYAHWYTASWDRDTSGTIIDGDYYCFCTYSNSTYYWVTNAGNNSYLTRQSSSSIQTGAMWRAQEYSTNTRYHYLVNTLNDSDYMLMETQSSPYPAVAVNDDATISTYYVRVQLASAGSGTYYLKNSYGEYLYYSTNYSSYNYIWSETDSTAFRVYHFVYQDLNAGTSKAPGGDEMMGAAVEHLSAMSEPALPNKCGTVAVSFDKPTTADAPSTRGATRGTSDIFTDGFESAFNFTGLSSSGWSAYNAGSGSYQWQRYSSEKHGGSYSASYRWDSTYAANCYLISEPFTVSSEATGLDVSIWEKTETYTEAFEAYLIKASGVSTVEGAAAATKYEALKSASYANTSWAQVSGSVSASDVSALAGQSVRLVIHGTSAANKYRLYVDDVVVTETTGGSSVTYELVSDPQAGDDVVIVIDTHAVKNSVYEPSTGHYLNAQTVTVNSDNTITLPDGTESDVLWRVGGSASGWTFYNEAVSKYMGYSDDYYVSLTDDPWEWLYDRTDLDNQCTVQGNQNSSGQPYRYLSYKSNYDDFSSNVNPGQNVKFYKRVDPNAVTQHAITWSYYDADGTQKTVTAPVDEGTVPTAPTVPATYTKDGVTYAHTGWTPEIVPATAPATYTATYSVQTYTITWKYKNSSGAWTTLTSQVAPNATPVPALTPSNYTVGTVTYRFTEWSPAIVAATGPATYEAQYTSITYTITWHVKNSAGEWTIVTTEAPEGVVPTYGTHPVWTDNNGDEQMFASWNTAEDGTGTEPVAAAANAEYWAQYEKVGVYTYTMYLYAVYGRSNKSGLTHIFWYANNGTADNNGGGVRQEDNGLEINAPTDIPTPENFSYVVAARDGETTQTLTGLTYVGHTFLGWARVRNTDDNDGIAHPEFNSVDDCWLVWHDNGDGTGYYTVNNDNKEEGEADITGTVDRVRADEFRPYHDLYAVWESHVFYVYHSSSGQLQAFSIPTGTGSGTGGTGSMIGTFDITKLVPDGYLYGGYYKTYGGVNMTELEKLSRTIGYSTWTEGTLVSGNWTELSNIETEDNAQVSFVEYDGKDLKNGNKKFWTKGDAYNADILEGLPSGFTAADVNGETMKPVADTIYYLKEVPELYLHSYYAYVYGIEKPTNDDPNPEDALSIDAVYLLTAVDDNNYKTIGFRTGSDYAAATAEGNAITPKTALATNFMLIQKENQSLGIKAHTSTISASALAGRRGYIAVLKQASPASVTMMPSWKTLDGVVIGNVPLNLTVSTNNVTPSPTVIPEETVTRMLYVNVNAIEWWTNDRAETRVKFSNNQSDPYAGVQVKTTQVGTSKYYCCAVPDGYQYVRLQRYVNGAFRNESVWIDLNENRNCIETYWPSENNNPANGGVTWKTYIP